MNAFPSARCIGVLENMLGDVKVSDCLSVSRPLIAGAGLYLFPEHPVELAAAISLAFITDWGDGFVARRYGSSRYGAHLDIFADRALEYACLVTYAAQRRISWIFPAVFITKGVIFDTLRLRVDAQKGDFSKPLAYGGNDKRLGRCAYGFVKMAYLSWVVPFGSCFVNSVAGAVPTGMGLWRAYKTGKAIRRLSL